MRKENGIPAIVVGIGVGATNGSYGFPSMTDDNEKRWIEFETLGEKEVRKRLAARIWSEEKEALARQWIDFREARDSSISRADSLMVAREANELARASNDLARSANVSASEANVIARRSATAAWTSSIIAAAALIASIIAIVVSVMKK